jgi:hypothetical protein
MWEHHFRKVVSSTYVSPPRFLHYDTRRKLLPSVSIHRTTIKHLCVPLPHKTKHGPESSSISHLAIQLQVVGGGEAPRSEILKYTIQV